MKIKTHIKLSILFCSITLLVMGSCEKDNVEKATKPDRNHISCKFDGEQFTSSYVSAEYEPSAATPKITIAGGADITNLFIDVINLHIPDPMEGRTYNLANVSGVWATGSYDETFYTALGIGGGSGTVSITYFDGEAIAGTFNLVATTSKEKLKITEGEFSVINIIEL